MAKVTKKSKSAVKPHESAPFVHAPAAAPSHFGSVQKIIGIPTVWADTVVHGLNRDGALVLLRFFSVLDDAAVEVARVQLPERLVKDVMISLSANLNYYPAKPVLTPHARTNGKKNKRT
jgi:hypothetical protein